MADANAGATYLEHIGTQRDGFFSRGDIHRFAVDAGELLLSYEDCRQSAARDSDQVADVWEQ